jgi:hypothetical protein
MQPRPVAVDSLGETWAQESPPPTPSIPHGPRHDVTRSAVSRESDLRWISLLMLTIVALVVLFAAAFFVLNARNANAAVSHSRQAHLYVESRPPGAEVILNGQARGITPLALVLNAGRYSMILRRGAEERTVPLQLVDGAQVQHYFDFAPSNPPISTHAEPSIGTDPPVSQVGRPSAPAPLVGVAATNASVPSAGWLTVLAPFETEIYESNDLLGTSRASKLTLSAGSHDIVLDNQTFQYQENRRIEIVPGKTTTVHVTPPQAPLSANAQPWAEVFMDGRSIGQTPLANIDVPVGPHEVTFRHPQLGERGQTVLVTARGPNRISVDLRRK